jgi:hypothetical protein
LPCVHCRIRPNCSSKNLYRETMPVAYRTEHFISLSVANLRDTPVLGFAACYVADTDTRNGNRLYNLCRKHESAHVIFSATVHSPGKSRCTVHIAARSISTMTRSLSAVATMA